MISELAKRFLRSKASDGFIALITWVSVGGVFVGVVALIAVTSVINGFRAELMRAVSGMNGDVVLYTRGQPVTEIEEIESKVRRLAPQVTAIGRSFVTELMVSGPAGPSGAVLDGFDPLTLGRVSDAPRRVTEGRLPEASGEVALGYLLAEAIGAKIDDNVTVISPYTLESEITGKAKDPKEKGAPSFRGKVVGLFKMGMYEYDSKFLFTTLAFAQEKLLQPGAVTSFKLKTAPDADSFAIAKTLSDGFGHPFRAKNWGQLNAHLFYAIQVEKTVIAIIMAAIVLVAAFNILSTLMMLSHEKKREMSILKAMGFSRSRTFRLFSLIGVFIGAVGVVSGLFGGLGVNGLIKKVKWFELAPDVYHIDFLPVVENWSEIFSILIFALSISMLASLIPALRMAWKTPLEGFRDE